MIITSDYNKERKTKLTSGDIVFMRGATDTRSFYGIYCQGLGIINLITGSNANCSTPEPIYLGDVKNYWTVEKVFKNCEFIIRE